MLSILNISTYRFVYLTDHFLLGFKELLEIKVQQLALKGSILLSTEGINLFLSGQREAINLFKAFLSAFHYFQDLIFMESLSNVQPFKKMLVKIKKEIIPFGISTINPEKHPAPYVTPETLKTWLKKRPDLVLLDTRNSFEVQLGSFEHALHLNLKHFRDFPNAVKKLPETLKKLPIVTFCTGGIRCEKAAAFLLTVGFKEVYQLKGGILHYFEKCAKSHYKGLCFVFDARSALTPSLESFC